MPSVLLALFSAAAFVALGDLREAVPAAIGLMLVWGIAVSVLPSPRWSTRRLLEVALLLRMVVLAAPMSLSDDAYRYLWEGRVVVAGGNPYLQPPSANIWDAFGPDVIRESVAHANLTSAYPPLAIWLFAGLAWAWYDPLILRFLMAVVDSVLAWTLGRVLLGRKKSLNAAWLYALHPLAIVHASGSGHLEPLALLTVALAIHTWDRGGSGAAWATIGGLVKLMPFVLLGTLWRQKPKMLIVAAILVFLATFPFVDGNISGLETYLRTWTFNAAIPSLLTPLIGSSARWICLALGAGVCLWAWMRRRDPAEVALWVGGAFVLLSPTVHPWYVLWAWVPALICGVRSWTVLACLAPISYTVLASYDSGSSTWSEPWWPPLVEYLPFLAALLWECVTRWTLPGPWANGVVQTPSQSASPMQPAPST